MFSKCPMDSKQSNMFKDRIQKTVVMMHSKRFAIGFLISCVCVSTKLAKTAQRTNKSKKKKIRLPKCDPGSRSVYRYRHTSTSTPRSLPKCKKRLTCLPSDVSEMSLLSVCGDQMPYKWNLRVMLHFKKCNCYWTSLCENEKTQQREISF